MILKLLFIIISYLVTAICIFGILRFQPKANLLGKSVLIMTILYSLPAIVDIVMFFIILTVFIAPGEYGTGAELFAAVINLVVLIPIYKVVGNKTYKKFKVIYPDRKDLKVAKALWKSAIIKAIFIISAVIWIVEIQ